VSRHRLLELQGNVPGALCVRARHEDDELVAPVAGDYVRVATVLREERRELPKKPVTGLVPLVVVDLLHVVEIQEEDAHNPTVAAELLACAL
jgi:hypothetical protein